jgi:hypothetical protein
MIITHDFHRGAQQPFQAESGTIDSEMSQQFDSVASHPSQGWYGGSLGLSSFHWPLTW